MKLFWLQSTSTAGVLLEDAAAEDEAAAEDDAVLVPAVEVPAAEVPAAEVPASLVPVGAEVSSALVWTAVSDEPFYG